MKELIVRCDNQKCSRYNVQDTIEWNGLSSVKLNQLKTCPECGTSRKVTEGVFCKAKEDFCSVNVARVASMTPLERKEILKKRSNEHYKLKVEERKKYMDNEFFKLK